MPFGEVWSDPVRDAIGRSCTDLAGEGLQLDCERADEIAKPGRITEQIIAALRNADLIIADITESNPNVMFELGFADALGKQIIVLNQDVEAAPFDIKDWRAIAYSVRELDAAVRQLSHFIRTTLRQ
jgi:nucleoside 2-deoxyribosyltransferase